MSDVIINEKNLAEQLRAAFPEMESLYQGRVDKCDGIAPSNYEIFGYVFKPKFKQELAKGEITDFLRRSAEFIERVSNSADAEAINVVWIKIFEWLIFQPEELKLIWPILGSATKEHIRDAAQRWTAAGRHFGKTGGLPASNLPKD